MSDTSDFSDFSEENKESRQNGKAESENSNNELNEEVSTEPPRKKRSKNDVNFPVPNPFAMIKNKEIRNKHFKKLKQKLNKEKKNARRDRKKAGGPKTTGHTIESLREPDQTVVDDLNDSENEEIKKDLETDEFSEYYSKSYEPKVLITYADNPVTKTRMFGRELTRMIPNSLAKTRNRSSIKNLCKSAIREQFTDLIVINEDRRQPNGLVLVHLPNGPTAHFRVSNVKLTNELKKNHRNITSHRPEVILTNFSTRLGVNIGRMLGAIFHYDPQFRGRRAVTFHNQRDYIFFRHHLYEFKKEGEKAALKELGPRFTLKLRSLQQGTFDSKCGDYEWMITNKRRAMEGRRRFFL